jgi:hypothetical protein
MAAEKQKFLLPAGRKPEPAAKYEHMMPEDRDCWTRFIKEQPKFFSEVWYDMHVGVPVIPPEGSPLWMWDVADAVTRKRIDVIGRRENQLYVIEIKTVLNMKALGQAVTYQDLFKRDYETNLEVVPAVICELSDVDLEPVAKKLGVLVLVNHGELERI